MVVVVFVCVTTYNVGTRKKDNTMNIEKKKEKIKQIINELLTNKATDKREIEINIEMDRLSPDPAWSDYIFWSDDYIDENDNFLMENFLDKIFSYEPNIIIPSAPKDATK